MALAVPLALSACSDSPAPTSSTTAAMTAAATAGCRSIVPGDVNGDGYADLAVGTPGSRQQRGSVHLFYGFRGRVVTAPTGTAPDDVEVSQDTPGVPDTGEVGDRFGSSTRLADVNGDRCADLLVGSYGENKSGSVTVLYGSPRGLQTAGAQQFSVAGLFGAGAAAGAPNPLTDFWFGFGDQLAIADLDGDGISDVATSWAPPERPGSLAVVFGSATGLGRGRPALRRTAAQLGYPVQGISSLTAGDFDGDLHAEIAFNSGGRLAVLRLRQGTPVVTQRLSTTTRGFPKAPKDDAYYELGSDLAAGDLTGDGRDDLVVGDRRAGYGEPESEFGKGLVVMLPGSAGGLTTKGSQLWTKDSAGVSGKADYADEFGGPLAIGHLDGDRYADLVIGERNGLGGGGSVTVLRGGSRGLTTAGFGGTAYNQSTPGITGTSESDDNFGVSVSMTQLGGRGPAALIVGCSYEAVGTVTAAGSVTQLGVSATGPQPRQSQTLTLNSQGVLNSSRADDEFGSSLS